MSGREGGLEGQEQASGALGTGTETFRKGLLPITVSIFQTSHGVASNCQGLKEREGGRQAEGDEAPQVFSRAAGQGVR